ncbi:hypothetical protein [Bacillus thuringiensis]|uniref:hypothetical protein n=1 Tax=Bacillus thuringiensis TaxID=1428 RepID=UPI000CD89D86|nr:hypothetical protein [Bacillus thuringiensis]
MFLVTCDQSTQTPNRVLVRAKEVQTAKVSNMKNEFQEIYTQVMKVKRTEYLTHFLLPIITVLVAALLFLLIVWRI